MLARVIEYRRPNGRRIEESIELSNSVQPAYEKMLASGANLAAETLMTDMISLTIENNNEDLQMRLVPLGKQDKVREMYEEMLVKQFGS